MEFITNWIRIFKGLILNVNDEKPFKALDVKLFSKGGYLLLLAIFLAFGYQSKLSAQNIQGVAPLLEPKGGLAIDGNAYVKSPGDDPDPGDWLFETVQIP